MSSGSENTIVVERSKAGRNDTCSACGDIVPVGMDVFTVPGVFSGLCADCIKGVVLSYRSDGYTVKGDFPQIE